MFIIFIICRLSKQQRRRKSLKTSQVWKTVQKNLTSTFSLKILYVRLSKYLKNIKFKWTLVKFFYFSLQEDDAFEKFGLDLTKYAKKKTVIGSTLDEKIAKVRKQKKQEVSHVKNHKQYTMYKWKSMSYALVQFVNRRSRK